MLEFSESAMLSMKVVNPTFYTSQSTSFMEFDQTSIKEFSGVVMQRLDVGVKIVGSGLSDLTLEGAVYFNTLTELAQSVSKVANVPVYQSKDRQTIFTGHKKE